MSVLLGVRALEFILEDPHPTGSYSLSILFGQNILGIILDTCFMYSRWWSPNILKKRRSSMNLTERKSGLAPAHVP